MPWTPFHLGPALMLGLLLFSYLDLPTLLVASVAPDIEPAIATALQLSHSRYGWFHTLEGAAIASVVVGVVMYSAKGYTSKLASMLKLKQNSSFKKILLTSFLGVYSHILLDMPLHTLYDLRVPNIELTPVGLATYSFCVVSFLVGLVLYKHRTTHTAS